MSDCVLNDPKEEQVWCEVMVCHERILIGCIYCPYSFADNIEMLNSLNRIDHLMAKGNYTGLLLTGDFNNSFTGWNEYGYPYSS